MSAKVVGIVVATGKNIRAKNDASFDLIAEAIFACPKIEIAQVFGLVGAVTVANAIETGEVGRSFGGSDNLIDRNCVFGMRK